jgi:hypothetical protein
LISCGAAPKVPRFVQNTLMNVPRVKAKETKPIQAEINIGAYLVCDTVIPMAACRMFLAAV